MVPDNKKGSKTACDMNKGDRSQFEDWPNDQILDNLSNKINTGYNGLWASQVALVVKNPSFNGGDLRDAGSNPGLGRSPGGGHGNPFQYS